MAASSVLCAFDASFGAGLLETLAQVVVDNRASLLLACDTPYPEPMHSTRPLPDAFGVALVLAPQRSARSLAKISVSLSDAVAGQLDDAALEALRVTIPAARSLPLLRLIAQRQAAHVVLDYLDSARLAVAISPC